MISIMKAAILAIGSELLGPVRLDTNSLRITEALERYGVELVAKSVIGDRREALVDELRRRLAEAEVVITTGGLGPTADDLTRVAVAEALDRRLWIDEELVERIRALFARFGREMPAVNRRQAEVIEGAEILDNRRGSAPGLRLEEGGSTLFLFPGVPRELEGMIEHHLEPWLAERAAAAGRVEGIERRVLKAACLAESALEERIAPAYGRFGREWIGVLASPGEIRIQTTAHGSADERRRRLDEMQEALRELAGDVVFADREEDTLESVVGELLKRAGRTLTTAESCTGGLVAERLTRVPGSSGYFLGGVVSYSNPMKVELLGVELAVLESRGAVSEEVARAMATGVRSRYRSDYGIAITGIAGPGGGSDEKPVGTVHLAIAGPGDGDVDHRRRWFPGDRERVRRHSAQLALDMLRRRLLVELGELAAPGPEG
jgi:nicotinamide-nucleotide amidase